MYRLIIKIKTLRFDEKRRGELHVEKSVFLFSISLFFKLDFGNIVNTDFRVGGNDLNVVSTVKYFQK